jgi:hypothetical protein
MMRIPNEAPDLGDLIIVLLAGTLVGLRDRLERDGYGAAADVVGELAELADDYVMGVAGTN